VVEVPPWHRAILNFIEVGAFRNLMTENFSLVFQADRCTSGRAKIAPPPFS
jgi:hypothetical protein